MSVCDGDTNPQNCRWVVVVVVVVVVVGPLKLTIMGHHVRPVKLFAHFKTQVQNKLTSVSDDKYKGSHVHKNYKYGGWGINVVGSK